MQHSIEQWIDRINAMKDMCIQAHRLRNEYSNLVEQTYDYEQVKNILEQVQSMAAGIASLKGHQGTLYALSANAEAAAARIQDTDFARSSANLAKFSILNQSAMAMVSQANQANQSVLAVLQ